MESRKNKILGRLGFAAAVWNTLPQDLRSTDREQLKDSSVHANDRRHV